MHCNLKRKLIWAHSSRRLNDGHIKGNRTSNQNLQREEPLHRTVDVKTMSEFSLEKLLDYMAHHSEQQMSKPFLGVYRNESKALTTTENHCSEGMKEVLVLVTKSVASFQATLEHQKGNSQKGLLGEGQKFKDDEMNCLIRNKGTADNKKKRFGLR